MVRTYLHTLTGLSLQLLKLLVWGRVGIFPPIAFFFVKGKFFTPFSLFFCQGAVFPWMEVRLSRTLQQVKGSSDPYQKIRQKYHVLFCFFLFQNCPILEKKNISSFFQRLILTFLAESYRPNYSFKSVCLLSAPTRNSSLALHGC